jgi:hypothetical protein
VIDLLLEEDRTETRVESTDTLVLEDLAEAAHETASEGRLRDETNTSRLKRAQGDISEEFGGSGGSEVDSGSVVGSSLVTELVDKLLLEELITAELESTLKEVTGSSRTETGEESASTLVGNDLSEATNHTTVVGDRVKLDSGLDAALRKRYISTQLMYTATRAGGFGTRRDRCDLGAVRLNSRTYTSTGVRAP